jgi:O6-methylguanine-DNA--protein-cysteine methyltransferase
LRVLVRAGIPRDRYDTYVRVECAAGGLLVASSAEAITGTALIGPGPGLDPLDAHRPEPGRSDGDGDRTARERFEVLHRERTGRSAIMGTRPFRGLLTALRTGRARSLPLDLTASSPQARAVLSAVRTIPPGQLRPLSWILREAAAGPAAPPGLGADAVVAVLSRNPMPVLIPCHRATDERGVPCDAGYPPRTGDALRAAEGIDMARVQEWSHSGAVLLGSATTHIF